jgi:hypothetical protein
MLEPAGDLGFDQEPAAARRVIGVAVEDLLESDLAVQLAIQRHEHRSQPAPGVRLQDAEALAAGRGGADGVRGGAVRGSLAILLGGSESDMSQGSLDVGIAEPSQALVSGAAGRDGRQASLDIPVLGDVQAHHRVDDDPLAVVKMTEGDEMVGQSTGLVEGPGLEGGHELDLVDQTILEGE